MTNFYSVISNYDEVMPYYARPPGEFLHFTISLTSMLFTHQLTSLVTSCHIRHVFIDIIILFIL